MPVPQIATLRSRRVQLTLRRPSLRASATVRCAGSEAAEACIRPPFGPSLLLRLPRQLHWPCRLLLCVLCVGCAYPQDQGGPQQAAAADVHARQLSLAVWACALARPEALEAMTTQAIGGFAAAFQLESPSSLRHPRRPPAALVLAAVLRESTRGALLCCWPRASGPARRVNDSDEAPARRGWPHAIAASKPESHGTWHAAKSRRRPYARPRFCRSRQTG